MKNKKIRENELSYLAGLWDGDGTFAIQRLKTSKTKSKRAYWVRSTFTNTNETVVKMVDSILKKMGIKKTGLRSRQRKENWKMTYEFSINRLEDNKTLLTNLIPYLNGKKATAEIVLRFVSRRLLAKKETPYNPYTLDDDLQYDQVKQMNIKGKYPDHKVVSDIVKSKIIDKDLYYFGGLWDAEGCFSIKRSHKRGGHCIFTAISSVNNCNPIIANEIMRICDGLEITYHITQRQKRSHWAPTYEIEIKRLDMNSRFLKIVLPYMFSKHNVGSLLLEFVESRLRNKARTGNNQTANYTQKELDIFENIKKLNKKGSNKRAPSGLVEQSTKEKSREFRGTPNVKTRAILSQASKDEGATTISTESRTKRFEARETSTEVVI